MSMMSEKSQPRAIFYSFISIMCIIFVAYAKPTGNKQTSSDERAREDVKIFSGIEVPPPEILRFMRRFGYLESNRDGTVDAETLYQESAIVEAIKSVQKYGSVKQTGKLDNDTLNLFNSPRCGVPDIEGIPYYLQTTNQQNMILSKSNALKRMRRYVIGARPWKKRRIRYFIANWSYKLRRSLIESELGRAFQLWSKYSGLHFIRVNNTAADIIVGFGTGYHGDRFPFDGAGGILAHAYYPYDQGSFGGDIHFDEDENWIEVSTNFVNGVNFYAVAVHEIGHSLGLAHSPEPTSIMFPYYKGIATSLAFDDISAMRSIYSEKNLPDEDEINREIFFKSVSTTTRPSITSVVTKTYEGDYESVALHKQRYGTVFHSTTPSNQTSAYENSDHNICAGSFDAVTNIAGSIYIFKRRSVWRLTSNYTVEDSYPRHIFEVFPFLEAQVTHIDAAYERFDKVVLLFSGSQYWEYSPTAPYANANTSIPLADLLHRNISKIDAALVWPKNNLTYFFAGTKFWRYNDRLKTISAGYPKSMRRWPGLPNDIDAATILSNGKTYFFKRNLYWLYNNMYLRPERTYPRLISTAWLKNYCFLNEIRTQ